MAEPITVKITNLNSPIRTAKVSNKVAESAVTSVAGRVGDITLTQADIAGLENVNNTSDLNKPISTSTQAAIDGISLTPGPIGPSGLQGPVGPIGPSGAIGLTGPIGPIGPSGLQGLQGEIGPSGEQGIQGEIGPSGAIGLTGPAGADAVVDNTAYGIAWSGDTTQAATRDALYNEIEILPRFGDNVSEFNNDSLYVSSGDNISLLTNDAGYLTSAPTETLAETSSASTDAAKSLYTMSAGIPVEFESSDNNTLFYLDETNEHVGIGTTTPDAKLHVSGDIKIVNGTQGANKILTSDANGLASWQTPEAAGSNIAYTGVAVDYTGLADDYVVDATSADITISLPTAVGIVGKSYIVKNSSAGVITISPSGAETIDGETSIDTNSKTALTLLSTNSNWIII